ncbi:hypothetical protein [Haliscomenobacter sp.]|uniref:hypothetical protein n=1 Tax=Haliscomenobacter sp. TaxID=2717303 RepID=UPI00359394E9
MSEHNPLDDLFRDKLYHHSMETPMHLWAALDARKTAQDKEAQRRRLAWFLTAAILLLSLTGAIWMWAEQMNNQPEQVKPLKQAQSDTPIVAIDPAAKAEPGLLQSASNSEEQRMEEKFQEQSFGNYKTAVLMPNLDSRAAAQLNKASKGNEQAAASASPPNRLLDGTVQEETPLNTSAAQNLNTAASAQLPGEAEAINTTSLATEESGKIENFNLLDLRNSNLDYQTELGLDGTKPLYLPRTRGWRVYGELMAGMDVPTRSLQAREPEFELYRQAREQSEAVQNGYRAALRFSMISIDGIAVRSGLSYNNHRETFTYQQQAQQNSFQTIDIPVVVGYERNNLGKFTLSANAGVYLNMTFNQKGNFLSPDLNRVLDFSSKTPDAYPAFRNSLGLAFYGSIAASYPITPRLRLVLEPYVLRHSGSFTANDYAIDQRYQNWGIQLGLRKKINKYIYFAKP